VVRRRVASVVVAAAVVGSACSGPSGLSPQVRSVIGEDAADCVGAALAPETVEELNAVFDDAGTPSLGARRALARAYADCTGEPLAEATAEPGDVTPDALGDGGSTGAGSTGGEPGVGSIGRDALDPDAEVVAPRDAALSLPATVRLAGWDITVTGARNDRGDAAQRSSEGGLYVITLRAVNRSGSTSDLFFDVDWGTIAADGTIYENTCGVALDDDLAFVDAAPDGGTQVGSFCLTMPPSVAADVTDFYLQESLTPEQAIAWFTTN